jgi:hypothetical protein
MKYNAGASNEALQLATDSAGISVRYQFSPMTIAPIGSTETGTKPLIPANQGSSPTSDEINQTAYVGTKIGSS